MRMRLILSAALLSAAFFAHAQATETAGRWWTEDKRDVLEVSPCPEGLCGRLVGLSEPNDEKGQPQGCSTLIRFSCMPRYDRG